MELSLAKGDLAESQFHPPLLPNAGSLSLSVMRSMGSAGEDALLSWVPIAVV